MTTPELDLLLDGLDDPNARSRRDAEAALQELGVDTVEGLLNSAHAINRRLVASRHELDVEDLAALERRIRALGRIGSPRGLPMIQAAIRDSASQLAALESREQHRALEQSKYDPAFMDQLETLRLGTRSLADAAIEAHVAIGPLDPELAPIARSIQNDTRYGWPLALAGLAVGAFAVARWLDGGDVSVLWDVENASETGLTIACALLSYGAAMALLGAACGALGHARRASMPGRRYGTSDTRGVPLRVASGQFSRYGWLLMLGILLILASPVVVIVLAIGHIAADF